MARVTGVCATPSMVKVTVPAGALDKVFGATVAVKVISGTLPDETGDIVRPVIVDAFATVTLVELLLLA